MNAQAQLDFTELERLGRQQKAVYEILKSGRWFTFAEIQQQLAYQGIQASEAGISARIRDCRKLGREIERRIRKGNLHEYRMV